MRFLKTLTLNRRAIYDDRLAITTLDAIVMNTPKNLLIPKGVESNRPGSPVNGMIRYNTDTDQFEGYQSGAWRQFRFKEPNKIILQPAGTGNGVNTVFPLSPQPATVAVSGGATWDEVQWAKNIIVIVGNVIQIANTNYVVIKGEDITIGPDALGPYTTGTKYLQFTSYVPGIATPEPVIVLHGFDQ